MSESVNKVEDVPTGNTEEQSFFMSIIHEIVYSPMNMALVVIIAYIVYKIIKDRFDINFAHGKEAPPEPQLPKLRRDFTIEELRKFDGNQTDGRILVAVNGNVYDVTKGKRFYGPGGPYASFAGRDASRNLATLSMASNDKDEYDDLSDLSAMEMETVHEWEMQFKDKYEYVGKLLRKGEQPTNYDEEEDEEDEDEGPTTTKAAENETVDGVRNRNVTATSIPSDQVVKDEESKTTKAVENETVDGERNRNVTATSTSTDQVVN